MDYIKRSLHHQVEALFKTSNCEGLILAGVVGCGKTTLVHHVLEDLSSQYETFSYTGDDLHFREAIAKDTKYLFQDVRAKTQKRAIVFIDEVQKCADVFDAVKYAFDRDISFIVSGSNPHFLSTEARKRLQRRGHFLTLMPFSLKEVMIHHGEIQEIARDLFLKILTNQKVDIPESLQLTLTEKKQEILDDYLQYGGLPLVHQAKTGTKKLENIAKVVERGFEFILFDTNDIRDLISIELARVHSREFTYKTVQKQTGIGKRDTINEVINQLIGHGYLLKKKPLLFEKDRRTYLNVFSYIDPGMVSYLMGDTDVTHNKGQRVEGVVHTQLSHLLQSIPLKVPLHYFKPYTIDANGKTKFQAGEIDFVLSFGNTHIPIEVKSSPHLNMSEANRVKEFIRERKSPFGVITYGGVPYWDKEERVLYWPYWLI
ncbi:AAA family ATPase [bacterium]|nr:AAA family ATPase [bacterium]